MSPQSGFKGNHRPFVRSNGRANPYKPATPDQIAAFAKLWLDPAYTLEEIGRRYRVHPRTLQKWNSVFGLPPRDTLTWHPEQAVTMADAIGQAVNVAHQPTAVARDMAQAAQAPASVGAADVAGAADQWNPLADPEIKAAMDKIALEARALNPHTDLREVQRQLSKLSVLLAMKMPTYTWQSLAVQAESLSRSLLWARRVEAELPVKGDPQQLRKEAASLLVKEMKSVLSLEEQGALGKLVKLAADRILARGNVKPAAPTDLPGAPPPGHNGKLQPRSSPPYPSV